MLPETIEELEEFMDRIEELKERAIPLLNYLAELDGKDSRFGFDKEEVNIDGYQITAEWDNYRCGESDYRTVSIDADDLLNPNFETELKERHEAKMRAQRERAEAARKQREREAYQRDFEKYKELHAKFANDPAAPRVD